MSLFARGALAALALTAPAATNAAWNKASTRHFIIYSEQKPEQLRAYAEKLERFDQAARKMLLKSDPPIGDGNRLTIFVVDDIAKVQRIHGRGDEFVYGFYIGRYSGPIAFTPRRTDDRGRGGLKVDSVFFHEYAHHLMFQDFDVPVPNWYVEGFAELIGTPTFGDDGSVTLGVAPQHRAYGLFSNEGLNTRQLLESQPAKLDRAQRESIYSRGWLLTHYFFFEPSRSGQLGNFIANLSKGQSMAAAASAFGDLKQLDQELGKYVQRPRLLALTVAGRIINPGRIDVTPVGPGGNEALPWRMISKRGVNAAQAQNVVGKLRVVGARHPADPLVQVSLAEAEFDAGQHKPALAAAEAALRVDPKFVEALIYKGRSIAALAVKKETGFTLAMAREAYLSANKIDAEDPEPLFLYFLTFPAEGRVPTPNAISALHYASRLAPSDDGLRFTSALAWLIDKKLDGARVDLLPIAYNPHGGEAADKARAAIEKIDAKDHRGAVAALARKS